MTDPSPDLLAIYAVGAAGGVARAVVERAVRRSSRLRAELEAMQCVVAALDEVSIEEVEFRESAVWERIDAATRSVPPPTAHRGGIG